LNTKAVAPAGSRAYKRGRIGKICRNKRSPYWGPLQSEGNPLSLSLGELVGGEKEKKGTTDSRDQRTPDRMSGSRGKRTTLWIAFGESGRGGEKQKKEKKGVGRRKRKGSH